MSSTARQGSANLTPEFVIGRDIDAALQDVQTKVSRAVHRREVDERFAGADLDGLLSRLP